MLRVAIVEDEQAAAQQLRECLLRFGRENNLPFEVTHFANGALLAGNYRPVWDLLLLDIDTPVMNGLEAARSIRETDPDVGIVFITNLAQYAINGYEVRALDYLLKPVNYYALSMKLKRVLRLLHGQNAGNEEALMLKRNGELVRVPLRHLYYIEVFDHKLRYHTADGEFEVTGAATMTGLEKELTPKGFVRCHNCYLANLRVVDGLRGNMLVVAGQELPISRNRRRAVVEALLACAKGV